MKRFLTALFLLSFLWNTTYAFSFGSLTSSLGSVTSSFQGAKKSFTDSFSSFSNSIGSIKNTFNQAQNSFQQITKIGDSVKSQFNDITGKFEEVKKGIEGEIDLFNGRIGELKQQAKELPPVKILGEGITEEQKKAFTQSFAQIEQKAKEVESAIAQEQEKVAQLKQNRNGVQKRIDELKSKQAAGADPELLKQFAEEQTAQSSIDDDIQRLWNEQIIPQGKSVYPDLEWNEMGNTSNEAKIERIAGVWGQLTASSIITNVSGVGDDTTNVAPVFNVTDAPSIDVAPKALFDTSTYEDLATRADAAFSTLSDQEKSTIASLQDGYDTVQKQRSALLADVKAKKAVLDAERDKFNTAVAADPGIQQYEAQIKEITDGNILIVNPGQPVGIEKSLEEAKIEVLRKQIDERKDALNNDFEKASTDLVAAQNRDAQEGSSLDDTLQTKSAAIAAVRLGAANQMADKAVTATQERQANEAEIVARTQLAQSLKPGDDGYAANEAALKAAKSAAPQLNIDKNKEENEKTTRKREGKEADLEKMTNKNSPEAQELKAEIEELKQTEIAQKHSISAQTAEMRLNADRENQTEAEKKLRGDMANLKTLEGEKIAKEKAIAELKNKEGLSPEEKKARDDEIAKLEGEASKLDADIAASNAAIEEGKALVKDARAQTNASRKAVSKNSCQYQDPSGNILYASKEYCVQFNVAIGKDVSVRGKNGVDLFGAYVGIIYRYGASIIGILAVLVIVISGVQISMAGFNSEFSSQAKTRIMQALASLVLLFLIGMILKTVNPGFFAA